LLELKEWLSFYERFWENKMAMLKHYVENGEGQIVDGDGDDQ
jgi:hypothetical protein